MTKKIILPKEIVIMADNKNVEIPAEASVSQELDRFEAWVIENSKKILIGSGVIVVVVAIVASIWMWVDGAEGRSRKAFAAAVTQEQIENTLKKFDKGPAAAEARVRLARILAKNKNYVKAAALLEQVANDPEAISFLRGRAAVDAAGNYELAGKAAEAEKAYAAAADNTAFDEAVRVEAAYGQGRLLAAKKDYAGARLAFKRAAVKNPANKSVSFWSGLAGRAMDRLPAGK